MREASLLASKFFKELAEIFNEDEGQGKWKAILRWCPAARFKFSPGEDFSQQKWLEKSLEGNLFKGYYFEDIKIIFDL